MVKAGARFTLCQSDARVSDSVNSALSRFKFQMDILLPLDDNTGRHLHIVAMQN